jgi:hypothetical protein
VQEYLSVCERDRKPPFILKPFLSFFVPKGGVLSESGKFNAKLTNLFHAMPSG